VIPPECRQAWDCCIFPTLSNMTDYPIFVYMFWSWPAILYTNVATYIKVTTALFFIQGYYACNPHT
jgi:hypothetical protein